MTNFKPNTNDVILEVRDVANTPLDSHIWEDEDFEEDEEGEETPADRALAVLEAAGKRKEKRPSGWAGPK